MGLRGRMGRLGADERWWRVVSDVKNAVMLTPLALRVVSVAKSTGVRDVELAWNQQHHVLLKKDPAGWVCAAARAWYDDTDQAGEARLEIEAAWLGEKRTYLVECDPVVRVTIRMKPVDGPDGEERVSMSGKATRGDLAALAEVIAARCARASQGEMVYTFDRAAKEIAELAAYIRNS